MRASLCVRACVWVGESAGSKDDLGVRRSEIRTGNRLPPLVSISENIVEV